MFDDFKHGLIVTERRWYDEKKHTYPYVTWKVSAHRRAAPRAARRAARHAPHATRRAAPHTQPGGGPRPHAAPQLPLSCPLAAPPPHLRLRACTH